MQFGDCLCVWDPSHTGWMFFFSFSDHWCMSASASWTIYVCVCAWLWVVSFICVCLQFYLCVCVCVLCEEASVGFSFISGGSSCVQCSSGGAVSPAADAAWAPATWTCGLNTLEHTHTHKHIVHTVSQGHWPGFRTQLSAPHWCQRMFVESVEVGHTQAMTFSRSGQLKSNNNNWQLNRNTHSFYFYQLGAIWCPNYSSILCSYLDCLCNNLWIDQLNH